MGGWVLGGHRGPRYQRMQVDGRPLSEVEGVQLKAAQLLQPWLPRVLVNLLWPYVA